MTEQNKRVNFDEYADRYEDLLKEQLAFFSKNRGYFSEYKVVLAAAHCIRPPAKILDFGCGIGLSLPYLARHFPNAKLFATDPSKKSLAYVREKFSCLPNFTALPDELIDGRLFDMIFVSGVIHHVPINQRAKIVARLAALLINGGQLYVFEHNPFNPVTRHMVSTCPFDEDAVLIPLREMKNLVRDTAELQIVKAGYCLFFPQALQVFRPLEKVLRWLPLGGQYFVIANT